MAKVVNVIHGTGNLKHNNRDKDSLSKNIDIDRIENNKILVQKDIKEVYKEQFGEAVQKYNSKQKRKDRKIDSYYSKINQDKQKELFYEFVIQIGDMHDTNCADKINSEKEIEILEEYAKQFQEKYPNLIVINAVIHLDEQTPHLHLDYIPVINECKTGMEKQTSLTKAWENITGEKGIEAGKVFLEEQRSTLEVLMKAKNIDRVPPKKSTRKTLPVPSYKLALEEIEKRVIAAKENIKEDTPLLEQLETANLDNEKLKLERDKIAEELVKSEEQKNYFSRANMKAEYARQIFITEQQQKLLDRTVISINKEAQNINDSTMKQRMIDIAIKTQKINNDIKKTDQDKKDFLRKQLAELKEFKEGTSQIEDVINYLKEFIYKLLDINVTEKEVADILVELKNEKVELQFDNNNELEERLFEVLDLPEEKLKDIDRG